MRIQIFSKGGDGSLTLLSPENGVGGHDYMEIAGDGTWTYDIDSADLPVGVNDLVIIATDQAGNETTIEQTLEIDTDVTAGTVVLASESNSGTYEADGDFIDNKTNDATPRLTGTAEPHATVDLYLGDPDGGGILIGRDIPTDAEGNWYFDVDTDTRTDSSGLLRQAVIDMDDTSDELTGTSYSFVARVTDRADNVADATGTIVLDTQAPDEGSAYGRILPTPITVGTQTVYSDTGLDHTDGYTSETQPTLIGEVPEGHSRVDVYITYPGDDPANPTLVGTTKADANGDWELEFPDSATPLAGSPLGRSIRSVSRHGTMPETNPIIRRPERSRSIRASAIWTAIWTINWRATSLRESGSVQHLMPPILRRTARTRCPMMSRTIR